MSYNYNSTDLVKETVLTPREEFLLKDSKTFCIYLMDSHTRIPYRRSISMLSCRNESGTNWQL